MCCIVSNVCNTCTIAIPGCERGFEWGSTERWFLFPKFVLVFKSIHITSVKITMGIIIMSNIQLKMKMLTCCVAL